MTKPKIREAQALQFAAILVASPRYMGAFALAIGINLLDFYTWFAHVEVWSGLFMAILEGLAIAFVFRKWRSMRAGTTAWRVLLSLLIALMVALPLTAAPYLAASQLDAPIQQLMPAALRWAWSFLVAAIAPLVLAAVGYADREVAVRQPAKPQAAAIPQPAKPQAAAIPQPAADLRIACPHCGKMQKNQQGLNAHKRYCEVAIETNGRAK